MKNQHNPLNRLYRKILNGSAQPGDKERLARWMAGLDVTRDNFSSDELMAAEQQSRNELRERFLPQKRRAFLIRPWMMAASITIVVISTILFLVPRSRKAEPQTAIVYASISTKAGERKKITLEDGSVIVLNSASHIRYPEQLGGNTREIDLAGQAYFEVSHDSTRPFIVHAGALAVQVLGTSFDVRNYREDGDASVTVTSGKVKVAVPATSVTHTLALGEQLTYDKKTGTAARHTVEAADFLVLKNGGQVIRNEELREVCRLLERTYGVAISIRSPELAAQRMNLRTRSHEPVSAVMEMLANAGHFRYSIKDSTIKLWK